MKNHATARLMTEFKRVLHHEWSFAINRWKLNTERIKSCEYDEVIEEVYDTTETFAHTERTKVNEYEEIEEFYETTEIQRTEKTTVEIEIRLTRMSKIYKQINPRQWFGKWRSETRKQSKMMLQLRKNLKHAMIYARRFDIRTCLHTWKNAA